MNDDVIMPPVHPGEILLTEFLEPLELSQYQLARSIAVPARRINEIVHGQRGSAPTRRSAWLASSEPPSGSG
jgi:addiction module HigA family antidote